MRIRVGIALFLVLVLGAALFFVTRSATDNSAESLVEEEAAAPVALAHSYEEGAHEFVGVRNMPTVCDSISAEAVLLSENEVEVRITEVPAEGMCLMRSTPIEFSAAVEAPEDAVVTVLLNGVPVEAVIE